MYIGLYVNYLPFLTDFNENSIFATGFWNKNTQISNFMKIRPVGAEFSCGRTDRRDEANNRFSKVCERH
jgi:hypothetical protein